MLKHMTAEDNPYRLSIEEGEDVVLMVNNLGGTSKLEELIVCREAVLQLGQYEFDRRRFTSKIIKHPYASSCKNASYSTHHPF